MTIDALPIAVLVPIGLPLACVLGLAYYLVMRVQERRTASTLEVGVESAVLHAHAHREVAEAEAGDEHDERAEDDPTADVLVIHGRIVPRRGAA